MNERMVVLHDTFANLLMGTLNQMIWLGLTLRQVWGDINTP